MVRKKDQFEIDSPSRLGPEIGVTAENYLDQARAFVRRAGEGFVIRAIDGKKGSRNSRDPATEAEWIAWLRYFDAKGIPSTFLVDHGLGTVPTRWPEDFDAEAPTSDRFASLPKRSNREMLAMREFVAPLVGALNARVQGWDTDASQKSPQTASEARQTASERLAELEAARNEPITVGEPLARKLREWWSDGDEPDFGPGE
jgi:hypothetical protein